MFACVLQSNLFSLGLDQGRLLSLLCSSIMPKYFTTTRHYPSKLTNNKDNEPFQWIIGVILIPFSLTPTCSNG